MKTKFEMAFQNYYYNAMRGAKKRSDGALKRYESIEDPRAYSLDKKERSDFILGVVKRTNDAEATDDKNDDQTSQNEMINKIQALVKELKVCFLLFNMEV